MATYEYLCERCKAVVETEHGMTETPKINCPKCKKRMIRLITGGGGVIFKGGDWPGQDIKRERETR